MLRICAAGDHATIAAGHAHELLSAERPRHLMELEPLCRLAALDPRHADLARETLLRVVESDDRQAATAASSCLSRIQGLSPEQWARLESCVGQHDEAYDAPFKVARDGGRAATGVFRRGLRDSNVRVRVAALSPLCLNDDAARELVDDVLRCMRSGEWGERDFGMYALRGIWEPEYEQSSWVAESLRPGSTSRHAALHWISEWSRVEEPVARQLEDIVRTDEGGHAAMAFWKLVRVGMADAEVVGSSVAGKALWGETLTFVVEYRVDLSHVERLLTEVVRHGTARDADVANWILFARCAPGARPPRVALAALELRDRATALGAVVSSRTIDLTEADRRVFVAEMASPEPTAQALATRVLARAGSRTALERSLARRALGSEDPDARLAACEWLVRAGHLDKSIGTTLRELCVGDDYTVSREACALFNEITGTLGPGCPSIGRTR